MILEFLISFEWITIVLLLLANDVVSLLQEFDEKYQLRERSKGIFDLVKLLCFIIYIGHICGCFWHLIAMKERESGYKDD